MLTCLSFAAFAQKTGSVTGILADSANHKHTLTYATVSVYKVGDTVLHGYKLSDEKGSFKISNLEIGVKYRLVITAWQFKVLRQEIMLTPTSPTANLGTLFLSGRANDLEEVVVRSERPPIIVRKDTIEFNAESFKTLPTAVVEDLLKKLPGIVIGENGQMEYNGKPVSKLLVDGKEFFGGDAQIASKNLPSNIVDKVQVMDDVELKRQNPDLIAANMPQVINLKLKKAIKQGAFGKLYGGKGDKKYYEGGAILNVFRDTTQVSLIGYSNNVNKPGFSIGDVSRIGGFSRAGFNSITVYSGNNAFLLDGISFGATGSGVHRSSGGGANFNTLIKGGITVNGKYFVGLDNNFEKQLVNDNQTLGENRLITSSNTNNNSRKITHNIGGKMVWKIDSLTTVTVQPNVVLSPSRFTGLQNKASTDHTNTLLNESMVSNSKSGDANEYTLNVYLFKNFRKRGRVLNLSMYETRTTNLEDNFNYSVNMFYNPASVNSIDQLRNNAIRNNDLFGSGNYTEPLSKKLNLTLTFNSNFINKESALSTFFRNPDDLEYDIVVPTLSQTVTQSGTKSNARAQLRWAPTTDLSIQPGISYGNVNFKNSFSSYPSFKQSFNFVYPALTIRYHALNFSYSANKTETDVQYIQPVANNTDPLFVQNGNIYLQPTSTQFYNLSANKFLVKSAINYNINLSSNIKNNAVIMSRVISTNGVQTNTPINVDGVWAINSSGTLSKTIKGMGKQFTINGGYNTGYNDNVLQVNGLTSHSKTFGIGPRVGVRINLNDKLELNQNYNMQFSNTSYEDDYFADRRYTTQFSSSEIVLRSIKKLVFETTYNLSMNSQKIAGYNNSIKMWNAGITYLFLKNDRAQLKFSVNDILNSNIARYVSVSGNSIRDTQSNNIGRYGMLTMTYNIQNFGGKVGGKESIFGF
ncbi:outer membrane beta-barrel protein [Pedobacter duraquae]|uniref:outer membrane beta-barrel protein n=1 Tax=Pedobacter duraquae TaxID=425511 RepID=UPI001414EAD9|nr:outer membrane beta-barrel protein [Pedobacter duraquae]